MPLFEDLLSITPQELIYTVFLPFIITFAIFFGILSALRIFGKKINVVLSLALTIAAAYGGLFVWLSTYFLQLGAYVGIAAFVIIFIAGIVMWAFGSGRGIYFESLGPEKKLEEINKKIEKLYEKYGKESDPAKRRAIDESIMELEREKEHLKREIVARR